MKIFKIHNRAIVVAIVTVKFPPRGPRKIKCNTVEIYYIPWKVQGVNGLYFELNGDCPHNNIWNLIVNIFKLQTFLLQKFFNWFL